MSLIPEGTYPARATGEYEFGISNNGTDQIGVAFRIASGEHAGRVLTWFGYFNSEDNAKRAIKSLRACGWQGDDLASLDGIDSQEVNIVVEIAEHEGQVRNKIAWVNGAGVAMKNAMDERQKKALAARMRGLIATMGGRPQSGGGRPPQRQSHPDPAAYASREDDIPFVFDMTLSDAWDVA